MKVVKIYFHYEEDVDTSNEFYEVDELSDSTNLLYLGASGSGEWTED